MAKQTYTKPTSGINWNDTLDLHAWVETIDGDIIDEQRFATYCYVKRVHDLNDNVHYMELVGDEKKKLWKQIWKRIIKKKLNAFKELVGMTEEEALDQFSGGGMDGMCFLNAWAYHKKHPKTTRYCIGKMGWEKKDGSGVWWEYG